MLLKFVEKIDEAQAELDRAKLKAIQATADATQDAIRARDAARQKAEHTRRESEFKAGTEYDEAVDAAEIVFESEIDAANNRPTSAQTNTAKRAARTKYDRAVAAAKRARDGKRRASYNAWKAEHAAADRGQSSSIEAAGYTEARAVTAAERAHKAAVASDA